MIIMKRIIFYALSAYCQGFKMNFSTKLNIKKEHLGLTQKELCQRLYNIPHRTLQSWLQGEKEPPPYIQSLILFKLEYENPRK